MNTFGEATSLLIAIDEEQRKRCCIKRDFKCPVGVDHGLEGQGAIDCSFSRRPRVGHERRRRSVRRPVDHQSTGDSLLDQSRADGTRLRQVFPTVTWTVRSSSQSPELKRNSCFPFPTPARATPSASVVSQRSSAARSRSFLACSCQSSSLPPYCRDPPRHWRPDHAAARASPVPSRASRDRPSS